MQKLPTKPEKSKLEALTKEVSEKIGNSKQAYNFIKVKEHLTIYLSFYLLLIINFKL